MPKKYKLSLGNLIFIVLVIFLVGFIAGNATLFNAYQNVQSQKAQVAGEKTVEMGLPAVDADGNGVTGKLVTKIRPGSGQILVNVNSVLAQFDTQLSGRTAAKAAADYTKKDLSTVDIIYDIEVNATIIEGPSAGAAMATSIILGLEDIPSSKNIMITGSISENGSIGPVGAILEKATAARDAGATLFLVPDTQSSQLKSSRARTCKNDNGIEVCKITYDYNRVNVGSSLNITVSEVKNIGDVIDFYLKQSNKTDVSI